MPVEHAAIVYSFFSLIVFIFQMLLALGAPLGHLAMGGKYPGVYSKKLRVSAVFQGLLLVFFSLILLSNTEVIAIPWLVSTLLLSITTMVSFISFILNIITSSFYERLLWGPVTGGLFFSSLIIVIYIRI